MYSSIEASCLCAEWILLVCPHVYIYAACLLFVFYLPAMLQKHLFSEPPECRSGGLKNQIVAEVGVQGFLEPSETAYSSKFMRRRKEWKRGPELLARDRGEKKQRIENK